MEAIHRGEIKGLLSICFNPLVSLPDASYVREALEKLEFFGVVDFFLSETAQLRRRRPRRQPAGRGGGGRLQRRGAGDPHPEGGRSAGQRLAGQPHLHRAGEAAGERKVFPLPRAARDLRGAARGLARRRRGLLRHHLRADRRRARRLLALPDARTIRARRACSRADGSSIPTARRASRSPSGGRAAIRWTRLSRSSSPPGASSASISPAPRRGGSARWSISSPSRGWRSIRGWRSRSGSPTATG